MKRFDFRLDKVLRLRQQETEQYKRALAVALAQERECRRLVRQAEEFLTSRVAEVQRKEREGMTAFDFANLRNHVAYLQQELARTRADLAAAVDHTAARRATLVEGRRREKALERLKEKRLEDYTAELLREEQKELDEFGDRQGLNIRASRSEI